MPSAAAQSTWGEEPHDPASGILIGPAEHLRRLNDPERLAALEDTELMDAEPEAAFDRFTRLAARWLKAPTALISLVDDHRQFFKSAVGLAEPLASKRETPLSHSFCQYAVTSAEPLIVADAREHPFLRNSFAVRELAVVAYAGVPLITSDHHVLGALCVADAQPRPWAEEDVEVLRELAALTMAEIELRFRVKTLRSMEAERIRDQELLHSIVDCMDDALLVLGKSGNIILTNAAAQRSFANPALLTASDILQQGIFGADGKRLLHKDAPTVRALRGEQVRDQQLTLRMPGRPELLHSVNASPLRDESGEIYAAVGVGRDVTSTRAAERGLARSEAMLRAVVKNLPNCAVLLFDRDLRFLSADGERLLSSIGFAGDDIVGRTLAEVASPQGLAFAEPRYRAALAGEPGQFELSREGHTYSATVTPVKDADGSISSALAFIYDITDHKRLERDALDDAAQSRADSVKDELTHLLNRRGFLDLARKQLTLADGLQRPALLFFVDLNGMKLINDQLGHNVGDEALVEMAEVLRDSFRGSDVLARLGGDEFVALLLDAGESQIQRFSTLIQSKIEQRNARAERKYQLSASVGGAAYDWAAPQSIESLLAKADGLMYEQKKLRKAGG